MTAATGIGARVLRTEDKRFLTGTGRYVDDLPLARATYAYFLRSPHAHAKIKSIDTAAAKKMPGVVEIFTGKDLADAKVGGLICGWVVKDKHGQPHKAPPHPVMAVDTVRYVGDTVAMVVANSHDEAKDAAEAIKVDYDVKPANIDLAKALDKGAPEVHAEAPGNLIYDWEIGVKADVDAAFAKAAHVTKLDLVNNRLIPNAMEPRAAAAEYDKGTGNYTLWSTSQNPHVLRLILSAFVLGIPEHKLRVIAPDVGGGFGSKIFCYADETMVCWAASRVGRPIKWTAERSESFHDRLPRPRPCHPRRAGARQGRQVPGAQGRYHRQHGRLSLDLLDGGADLSLRHLAGRPVHDAADLRQRAGGAHPHRAGRRLSRRRAARGDLRDREHRQQGGGRDEDRSGRAAPEELHPVDRLPVPDAGGAAVRFGQLPADHRRGDEARRLQGLRGPPRRGQVARQAARHRLLVLHRGLRPGARRR